MQSFPEYTEKPGACKDCGNSPTNHFLKRITSDIDVRLGIILKSISDRSSYRNLRYFLTVFGRRINGWHFALSEFLHLVRYSTDIEKARSYRSRVVWEEAKRRGLVVEHAYMFGRPIEIYRVLRNDHWEYFESIPMPVRIDQTSGDWIDDKVLLKEELSHHAIPVPAFASATTLHEAKRIFKQIGKTVIVKPRVGTRGRHTTTHISNEANLVDAFKKAKQLCGYVAIEEELQGSVCRATIVDGKLVGFFQADPPRITGNGTSTIFELVQKANASRDARVGEIELHSESIAYLKRQGYTPETILPPEQTIALTHRTGRLFGGKTRELLETVHPDLKSYLERAAKVLNIAIVGFDLIIADPETKPQDQRWGIIEANTLPFIDLHYLPLYGKASNPASAVWELWEKGFSSKT